MIILDTHTLVWLTEGNEKLGEQAKISIHHAFTGQRVFVSAISFWEVAVLCQKQRVFLSVPVHDWRSSLLDKGLQEFPLTGKIALMAAHLSDFHPDPADRFIAATAICHDAVLITADRLILNWNGKLQRQNAKL